MDFLDGIEVLDTYQIGGGDKVGRVMEWINWAWLEKVSIESGWNDWK